MIFSAEGNTFSTPPFALHSINPEINRVEIHRHNFAVCQCLHLQMVVVEKEEEEDSKETEQERSMRRAWDSEETATYQLKEFPQHTAGRHDSQD